MSGKEVVLPVSAHSDIGILTVSLHGKVSKIGFWFQGRDRIDGHIDKIESPVIAVRMENNRLEPISVNGEIPFHGLRICAEKDGKAQLIETFPLFFLHTGYTHESDYSERQYEFHVFLNTRERGWVYVCTDYRASAIRTAVISKHYYSWGVVEMQDYAEINRGVWIDIHKLDDIRKAFASAGVRVHKEAAVEKSKKATPKTAGKPAQKTPT